MKNPISTRGIVFLAIFALLAFFSLQISIFKIEGVTSRNFTGFDFFGPVAGGFLGIAGVASVFIAKLAIFVLDPKADFTIINILWLTPMIFGAYYFWKNGLRKTSDKLGLAVPVLAMFAFWMHPIGQQAWYYALFWTIPIIAKFLPDRLFLRSLGATFSQHSIGSVLALYTGTTTAGMWTGLLPVTATERILFAIGIAASYVIFTNVLNAVDTVLDLGRYVNVEKRYVLQLNLD